MKKKRIGFRRETQPFFEETPVCRPEMTDQAALNGCLQSVVDTPPGKMSNLALAGGSFSTDSILLQMLCYKAGERCRMNHNDRGKPTPRALST